MRNHKSLWHKDNYKIVNEGVEEFCIFFLIIIFSLIHRNDRFLCRTVIRVSKRHNRYSYKINVRVKGVWLTALSATIHQNQSNIYILSNSSTPIFNMVQYGHLILFNLLVSIYYIDLNSDFNLNPHCLQIEPFGVWLVDGGVCASRDVTSAARRWDTLRPQRAREALAQVIY